MSSNRRHEVFLVRMECDTSLDRYEAMDALNWSLDTLRNSVAESDSPPVDVSAIKWTLAVDVTPPRGID